MTADGGGGVAVGYLMSDRSTVLRGCRTAAGKRPTVGLDPHCRRIAAGRPDIPFGLKPPRRHRGPRVALRHQSPHRRPVDEALTPAGAIKAMKGDLLQLVGANEVYFAKRQWYSEDLHDLTGFRASPGVMVTIMSADADGWSATATSTLLPGKSCVIFVGPVKVPPKTSADGRSGSEAVPVCDAAPKAER